ncbi:MAG: arginine--tRNA ligase, partial [Rhodoferax sp.]|nr:arginine--tRNA ligase [Rhodoferax sp.]
GSYTYDGPDVDYDIAKGERGFSKVVNNQGTVHHGTVARVRAGLQAANVGIPLGYPDYVLHTMVRVVKGGEEVKISKRAGSYVTLRDIIDWTSKDAVRFFLLSRKPDTEYTFDIDLAVAQSNDNPVYYVQYAHARIQKMLRDWGGDVAALQGADLSPLLVPQAQTLMLQLAKYPEMLTAASETFAPHDVTFYLRELAANLHSYYDAERVLVDDQQLKHARLALVAACAQVLHNGLAVLGVSAPNKM